MLTGFDGFAVALWKGGCGLANWEPFGGELGEFTVTRGGEQGAESDVVETGRCSILEICCRGRGTDGPAVPRPFGMRVVSVIGHGEDTRGMSREARVLF